MANTTGKHDDTPYGLWIGGLFVESRRTNYRVPETNETRPIQIARMHVNTGDVLDRYILVRLDPNATLTLPKDQQILVNIRAWVKDRKINHAWSDDYAYLAAPEVAGADGELVPARGVMVIGRYLGLIQQRVRDWDNPAPNATKMQRRIRFHMPRPTEPDHAEIDIPPDMTVPNLKTGTSYLVPVKLIGTKQGLAYELVPSFTPQPIGAEAMAA